MLGEEVKCRWRAGGKSRAFSLLGQCPASHMTCAGFPSTSNLTLRETLQRRHSSYPLRLGLTIWGWGSTLIIHMVSPDTAIQNQTQIALSISYARDWLGRLPGPLVHGRYSAYITFCRFSANIYTACTIDTKQAKCCHSCNGNIYKYHADSLV